MSSEIVPLGTFIWHTFSSSSRTVQISVLSRTVLSVRWPMRKCTGAGFEAKLKENKVWSCFPGIVSYCHDTPKTENISFI